jgi:hypothetical protein
LCSRRAKKPGKTPVKPNNLSVQAEKPNNYHKTKHFHAKKINPPKLQDSSTQFHKIEAAAEKAQRDVGPNSFR